ncbi:MAG: PAS domain S-box protein [Cyanobacteria bacterium J06592_8]
MTCLVNTPVPVLKVLFVEDDAIDRLAFTRFVRQSALPYHYVIATTLAEATRILEKQTFDIAILDFHLGDGTASELIEQIKTKKLPFIVATGSGDEEIAVQMMQQGAYDYLIKDPDRHYLKVLSTIVDKAITRKHDEEKIQLLTHALQNVHDGIYITDQTNQLLFINEALSQICQCSPKAVIGKPIQVLNQTDLTQLLMSAKSSQLAILNTEVNITASDGSSFTALLSESLLQDEEAEIRVGLLRDISKLKQVEQDLQAARDNLEQQVQQRTAQLQQANLSLQAEIQERKRVEARLRESEQRYATLAAAVPVGIFRTDVMGNCIYVNNHYCQISGLSSEAVLGDRWQQTLHPDDRERVIAEWMQSVQENRSFQMEYRFQAQNGRVTWVYGQAVAERDVNQEIVGYVGTITDISDRKLAEAALRDSEQRFRHLFESTPKISVQGYNRHRQVIYWNDASEDLYGYTKAEAIGQRLEDLIVPSEIKQCVLQGIQSWWNGEPPIPAGELNLQRKDGSRVVVFSSHVMLTNSQGEQEMYCVDIDLSERKQIEQQLQNLIAGTAATMGQDFFPALASHIAEALGVSYVIVTEQLDKTLHTLAFWANGSLQPGFSYDIVHTPCEQVLQRGALHCEHSVQQMFPDDLDLVDMEAESYLGIACHDIQGETIGHLCIISKQIIQDPQRAEQILRVFAARTAAELERQRAITLLEQLNSSLEAQVEERTAELQEQKQFLQTVLDTFPLSVFWKDRNSVYLGGNRNFLRDAGLNSVAEVINKTDYDLPWKKTEAEAYQADDRIVINSNIAKLGIIETQVQADGKQIWLETNKLPLYNLTGEVIGVLGTYQDISDRKLAEVNLRQSQEFLQTVLDVLPLCVFWKDRQSVYLGCNQNFANAAGLATPKEIVGKTDYDLPWAETEAEVYRTDDEEVMASDTNKLGIIETQVQADGNQVWIETSKVPLDSVEGEVIGILGMYQDITDRKRAEIALQAKTEELDRFFSLALDLLCIANTDGYFVRLNTQWEKTLGYPLSELEGSRFLDYVHPDDVDKTLAALNQLKEGKEVQNLLNRYRCRDGSYRWLEWRATPQGDLIYAAARDITERKQTEDHLRELSTRLNLAVESARIGIWDWNIPQNILVWDQQMYDLYDITPDEFTSIYDAWFNRLHPEDRPLAQTVSQHALTGEKDYDTEFRVIHSDGSLRFIKANAIVQRNAQGEPERMIGINYDITQHKQAEAQLKQTNEELARATRLKDEFLANMSHELRTPLNAILGMTEVLQEEVLGNINSQQQKALETVERSGSHLLELINDILDVSKIESGQMELDCTSVSIHHLCQSSLSFIKQQALKKRIQLEIKLPVGLPEVVVDERRIRQVLINLLNNAVKFTPSGGRITLEVTFPVQNTEELSVKNPLQIAIIDTGIGIPPEKMKKLFQPFVQIDSALNRQYSGTGLGLALVKRIVELHGGEVELTSAEGIGSRFTIVLPSVVSSFSSVEQHTPSPLNTIYPTQSQDSPLILLAEDNEANIRTISSYLRAKHYRLLIAKNGEEAITLAQSKTPDLIVMDIQMPKMDGLEAIKQIRQDPNLIHIPIVALTALAMSGDREQCLEAGASDYLSKPIKLKQLADSIQRLLA